jgi:hypothetical protein
MADLEAGGVATERFKYPRGYITGHDRDRV